MTKRTLSAEQIAAIASGASLQASAAQETAEATATDAAAAAATAAEAASTGTDPSQVAEATAAAAQAAAVAAEATATAGTAAAAAATAESELVSFLRSELTAANANILAQGIQIAQMTEASKTATETMPKLLEIARASVDKMRIALGNPAGTASTMSAHEVIAAHAETTDVFSKKFVVGGAAATSMVSEKTAVVAPNVHPLFVHTARSAGKK